MINGAYLSTMGALVQTARHATIANNLANSNTHGFKPDWSIFQAVPVENEWHPDRRFVWDEILMKTGGGVWNDKTVTNLKPGPFQFTGNPFDVALADEPGSGMHSFFMIRQGDNPDGDILYTRDGHFLTDQDGVLRTVSGDLVVGPEGTTVTLAIPPDSSIHIRDDGSIVSYTPDAGTAILGVIGVARTADYTAMKKLGDSRFLADGAAMQPFQAGVKGEYLEESSTNPIDEMTNMIEATRIYETNMRFLTIQDETLGETVRRIAAPANG
ncbi:MAG: flagellar hook-basal body protein [Planctomycetota bacterium]|jgi:flagellar basal body rod protein FlgG|nr:flagellar hook-basal body protein [Planctomycetota bacterium]